jgi:hypothetical protein
VNISGKVGDASMFMVEPEAGAGSRVAVDDVR